jgi:hypothetical protein
MFMSETNHGDGACRSTTAAVFEEPLRDARESAERVRHIVRDLKIFSRSDEETKNAVDVRRVIESSLRMAWNEIRHRARLVKDYGDVPLVEGNEGRLGQVFLNLIVNAAQAIPEGRSSAGSQVYRYQYAAPATPSRTTNRNQVRPVTPSRASSSFGRLDSSNSRMSTTDTSSVSGTSAVVSDGWHLFRRREWRSTGTDRCQPPVRLIAAHGQRDAEVENLDEIGVAVALDELDVLRLQNAMDDALIVRRGRARPQRGFGDHRTRGSLTVKVAP